jgi:hypothetical protein
MCLIYNIQIGEILMSKQIIGENNMLEKSLDLENVIYKKGKFKLKKSTNNRRK